MGATQLSTCGFERVWVSGPRYRECCGAHRFTGSPAPLEPDATMFSFTGYDQKTGPARLAPDVRSPRLASARLR